MDVKQRMDRLSRELLRHQYLYYVKAAPEISDREFDRLFDELLELEKKYPALAWENSPTRRIGSDLDQSLPEKPHRLPVLSLDKEYTVEGLEKWLGKTRGGADRGPGFVVEEKIDGASIVLYYSEGRLQEALTRGNGVMGNDVTVNVRTIAQVPLVVDFPHDFFVRGEIYIRKSDFVRFNRDFDFRYANPRNLAAGSLRNQKSAVVARVPLRFFAYEAHFLVDTEGFDPVDSHLEILARLIRLGFPVNPYLAFFSEDDGSKAYAESHFNDCVTGSIAGLGDHVRETMKRRDKLDHEIDGLVVKVNEIALREDLGATAHHPRWAIAFKFDAPLAVTRLEDIRVQIGRNGRVTPVARLEPVALGGSTVARATLHNQEYIDVLELGVGDTVSISRRGDVIPAVEEVIEKAKENPTVFKLPASCPFCGSALEKEGAHHFCQNRQCPERIRRSIVFFAGRDQMDIDTLGEKTIDLLLERGFIQSVPDLYFFDYSRLIGLEGFGERKVENIRRSVEKSKEKPFHVVLASLGFEGLGPNMARELVHQGFDSVDKIIQAASQQREDLFSAVEGFGEITARLLIQQFTDPANLDLIARLQHAGLRFEEEGGAVPSSSGIFKGQVWVITGSFTSFQPRSLAAEEIEKRGGTVGLSVTSKTTHLLCGSSPGSKLDRARASNVEIVEEPDFLDLLK